MTRPTFRFRKTPRLERLESRELLSSGGPSPEAQYMLELINLARTNPAAAADRVTSNLDAQTSATLTYYNVNLDQARQQIASAAPRPPLAWNDKLATTALDQSIDQANMGVQTHTGADGSDLNTRLDRIGYTNRASAGENAFAYAKSVDQAMEAFLIDWGVPSMGHFKNLLQPDTPPSSAYREVGIGIVDSTKLGLGPEVITQDFGSQNGAKADLLGVAYDESKGSQFYVPGEGRGDVTVQAQNLQTGQTSSVQTWDAGGYQIPLDPGQYQVTAKVGSQVVRSQQVSIGTQNVKVDFDLSQPWTGPAVASSPTPPQPQTVTPPAPTPQPARAPQQSPLVFSQPYIAPQASTPSFDVNWITAWNSWNASTGQPT